MSLPNQLTPDCSSIQPLMDICQIYVPCNSGFLKNIANNYNNRDKSKDISSQCGTIFKQPLVGAALNCDDACKTEPAGMICQLCQSNQ